MKTLALLATLVIVVLASSGSALAANWVVGYVSDGEPAGDSYGRIVTLCKDGTSDCMTDEVGVGYTGNNSEEFYRIDCSVPPINCVVGDPLNIEIIDDGSGYYVAPIQFSAGNIVQIDMQLIKDCTVPPEENRLTVYTDASEYYPLETVTITAYYEDDTCNPIVGATVAIEVNGAGAEEWVCNQDTTNDEGEVLCEMGLAEDATPGTWTVDASASGDGYYDTTNFDVLDCYDNDEDGYAAVECGGNDCDDADPTSYPGADESCDGKDNDCDGVTDDFSESCGTDTGACVSGTRTCTDGSWGPCEGSVGPTAEICDGIDNDCDGSTDEDGVCGGGGGGGGGAAENYCGNLYCDTDETCETCPRDCGECEETPPEEGEQCVPDWDCTDWSDCSPEGIQTRECTDLNACEGTFTSPDTERTCVYEEPAGGDGTQGADITGQFLGVPVTSLYWAAIIVMILVAAGGIILWKRK